MLDVNLLAENPEDELFQAFGDKYIVDAMRVVTTKCSGIEDQDMIYEALCIIVAMYINKVNTGKITERTLH